MYTSRGCQDKDWQETMGPMQMTSLLASFQCNFQDLPHMVWGSRVGLKYWFVDDW